MNSKSLVLATLAGGLAVTLSACGSTTSNNANANSGRQNGYGGYGGGSGFRGGIPGASGEIAQVSGSTAQVQSSSAQTAVTWNSSTTFTNEVTVTKAAIRVGDCVQAARARSTTGAPASSSSSTTLDAATVRIISTSGDCTIAGPGRGGFGGVRPSGAPTNVPNGGGQGGRVGGFGNFAAIGTVSSVSMGGFVVKPIAFGASTSSSPVSVTTSAATVYTETQKATASAVKVGLCMSANGATDSTGAVTARRVTLSQPTDGTCTSGFGGRFAGGGNPGQGAPQNG